MPGSRRSPSTRGTRRTCPGRRDSRPRGAREVGWVFSFASLNWKCEGEARALPELTLDREAAVQHLCQPAADRQTETRPAVRAGRRVIELPEVLEYLLLAGWRDANPGVAHRNGHHVIGRHPATADRDPALVRELERVAEEVEDDLLEFLTVGSNLPQLLVERGRHHQLRANDDRLELRPHFGDEI